MLLLAAPVMAATTITCVDEGNGVVRIDYDATADTEVRAFGLDVEVDASAQVSAVIEVNPNYYIYPGTIQITDGNVTSWGSPVAPANDPGAKSGLETGAVTLEVGSLYAAGDGNLTPALSGTLCSLQVNHNGIADCNVTITSNITRGGVVNINAETVVVGTSTCAMTDLPSGDCYQPGDPNYGDWVTLGKPECWCYPRQCLGDATGYPYGRNNYWVSVPDLTVMKDAWNLTAAQIIGQTSTVDGHVTEWACADSDRQGYGRNMYRVSVPELTTLKNNWNIVTGPDPNCTPGNTTP